MVGPDSGFGVECDSVVKAPVESILVVGSIEEGMGETSCDWVVPVSVTLLHVVATSSQTTPVLNTYMLTIPLLFLGSRPWEPLNGIISAFIFFPVGE